MSRVAALSMAALALFAPAGVNADAENVDCPEIPASGSFPDGTLCKSLPGVLDDAGFPRTAVEISSNELTIGAAGDDSADLTFNLLHDDGDFQFCFGFCLAGDLDAATLDAVRAGTATDEEQLAFAKNCVIDNGKMVFDDRDHDDGAVVTVPGIPVPADVIFYLIPDEEKESFAANPENFWATERHPLFSLSGANPEYLDQLVLFQSEGNTLFAWEDKTRVRGSGSTPIDSDEDFGDLVFKLDTLVNEKIPTDDSCPDECTGTVASYRPAENQEEIATADGNCACLTFECDQ